MRKLQIDQIYEGLRNTNEKQNVQFNTQREAQDQKYNKI